MTFTTALAAALGFFTTIWNSMVGLITGNSALMIFLAAGLIGTAFRIFKRAKKAVR